MATVEIDFHRHSGPFELPVFEGFPLDFAPPTGFAAMDAFWPLVAGDS